MKIGIFDSGIGGEAVAEEIRRLIPHADLLAVNDHENVPYGGRSKDEIIRLTTAAIQPLIKAECDCIVLACNTATTNAIAELRTAYPQQKFVGIEPMLKPARALTQTGAIAVLATPATLQSSSYQALKNTWTHDIQVAEPDCRDWAGLIEDGRRDEIDLEAALSPLVTQRVDVIVLACTHYHWLKEAIQRRVGEDVAVLEPSHAISSRIIAISGS